jgi:hypothetical protein
MNQPEVEASAGFESLELIHPAEASILVADQSRCIP